MKNQDSTKLSNSLCVSWKSQGGFKSVSSWEVKCVPSMNWRRPKFDPQLPIKNYDAEDTRLNSWAKIEWEKPLARRDGRGMTETGRKQVTVGERLGNEANF